MQQTSSNKREPICQFISLGGGCCTLSKTAVEAMGYGVGDQLAFHQDEENPTDWYISLTTAGFKLRADKDDSGRLIFNSSILCKMLLKNLGIDAKSVTFLVEEDPKIDDEVEYWPIVTLRPIVRARKK